MTTKPNALIAPIHEKAMPVILTTSEETETWLTAPWSEAKRLQRTAPDDALVIVPKPAALQVAADKFIALHKGDVVKALKEMIVFNDHLQERLDALSTPRRPERHYRSTLL